MVWDAASSIAATTMERRALLRARGESVAAIERPGGRAGRLSGLGREGPAPRPEWAGRGLLRLGLLTVAAAPESVGAVPRRAGTAGAATATGSFAAAVAARAPLLESLPVDARTGDAGAAAAADSSVCPRPLAWRPAARRRAASACPRAVRRAVNSRVEAPAAAPGAASEPLPEALRSAVAAPASLARAEDRPAALVLAVRRAAVASAVVRADAAAATGFRKAAPAVVTLILRVEVPRAWRTILAGGLPVRPGGRCLVAEGDPVVEPAGFSAAARAGDARTGDTARLAARTGRDDVLRHETVEQHGVQRATGQGGGGHWRRRQCKRHDHHQGQHPAQMAPMPRPPSTLPAPQARHSSRPV